MYGIGKISNPRKAERGFCSNCWERHLYNPILKAAIEYSIKIRKELGLGQ